MSHRRLSPSELGSLVGVWAHPDDECYLMSGTAILASAAGSPVACVTATIGEAGETSDETRWPQAQLAEVRRRELTASLAVLGIEDHTVLGLPDGGLPAVDTAVGVGLLCDVLDRLSPDTVLTFGPDGMTGHPDHVTVAEWAESAAKKVTGGKCRVLAATRIREKIDAFAEVNAAVYTTAPPPCAPVEDLVLEVNLDGDELDRKVRALDAQPSQTAALSAWMGADTYRRWVADEYWVLRA
jgi:LmbE family N-acetylglucosaminyl deacetylase